MQPRIERPRPDEPAEPVRVVALVGAECTGKTTLAASLAGELGAIRIAEALREFCDRHGRTPRREEQAGLIDEQIEREGRAIERARREGRGWVLCDSAPLATALYSVDLFGDRSLLGRALLHHRSYRVTLLTAADLPWQPDGIQRDGPLARARFDALLARTLRDHAIAFAPIAGAWPQRMARALAVLRTAERTGLDADGGERLADGAAPAGACAGASRL